MRHLIILSLKIGVSVATQTMQIQDILLLKNIETLSLFKIKQRHSNNTKQYIH